MTRAEFLDAVDELIAQRRSDAADQRTETGDEKGLGCAWPAIDASLQQDLAALGRVRSMAREFMGEDQ